MIRVWQAREEKAIQRAGVSNSKQKKTKENHENFL